MNGWLIFAGAVVLWFLLRRKRRTWTSATPGTGPRYWFEFIGQDGCSRISYRDTEARARVAARERKGRYVGRYDVDLGGRGR